MKFGISIIPKKPAMQKQLATKFSNCLHMPVETVEQFINLVNDINARIVNEPGEAMKKTQIIKGNCNEFGVVVQIEERRDMSWAEYCTSIKDQATQKIVLQVYTMCNDYVTTRSKYSMLLLKYSNSYYKRQQYTSSYYQQIVSYVQ